VARHRDYWPPLVWRPGPGDLPDRAAFRVHLGRGGAACARRCKCIPWSESLAPLRPRRLPCPGTGRCTPAVPRQLTTRCTPSAASLI